MMLAIGNIQMAGGAFISACVGFYHFNAGSDYCESHGGDVGSQKMH